ncbi:type II secretion system protein N [Alterisphingorhabdus coralli]|uniref:Type II secretion system protein N n=1 Tax=Alterisphingorhabdus coralli TaxID=3071408 RepID=A0AA97I2K7_9SPHN|nr:type II secretion system protein N [Parasphingorhabdus sp. SCSIO 66989]WOE75845.1 type II secretion system protein N [Parasphingorhabdus sp. SCSIO 66989]
MIRSLVLFAVLAGLVLLVVFLPMRLALDWSGLGERGLAARRVEGSVWSGTLYDARFGAVPLGTLEAGLQPASLLGTPMVAVRRAEASATGQDFSASLGGGTGKLVVEAANGDVPLDQIAGDLPIAAARLNNVALQLDDGRCQSASGEVQLILSSWLGRFAAQNGLRGKLQCDGDAVALTTAGQSGLEKLSFRVEPDGRYRAELTIQGLSRELGLGLRAMGFKASGNRLVLSTEGVLR